MESVKEFPLAWLLGILWVICIKQVCLFFVQFLNFFIQDTWIEEGQWVPSDSILSNEEKFPHTKLRPEALYLTAIFWPGAAGTGKGIWIPKSGNFLLVESGIWENIARGIRNWEYSSRNPESH